MGVGTLYNRSWSSEHCRDVEHKRNMGINKCGLSGGKTGQTLSLDLTGGAQKSASAQSGTVRTRHAARPFGLYMLLLRSLAVAAHELVNAACRIDELALACVEGVRRA